MIGRIVSICDTYGFIRNDAGVDYYFNEHFLSMSTEFSWLRVDSEVRFTPKDSPLGLRAVFVSLLDKPPFAWEEGELYVERASKHVALWKTGTSSQISPEQRILTSMEFKTGIHLAQELAMMDFSLQVRKSGANFILDCDVEVSLALMNGFAVTTYRARAVIGIYLKPLKVKASHNFEIIRDDCEAALKRRVEKLRAFEEHLIHGEAHSAVVGVSVKKTATAGLR